MKKSNTEKYLITPVDHFLNSIMLEFVKSVLFSRFRDNETGFSHVVKDSLQD